MDKTIDVPASLDSNRTEMKRPFPNFPAKLTTSFSEVMERSKNSHALETTVQPETLPVPDTEFVSAGFCYGIAFAAILQPITTEIRAHEVAKSVFGFAFPATVLLVTFNNRTTAHFIVATGIYIGVAFIWNGIALKSHCPDAADICENLGIIFAFVSVTGLLIYAAPKGVMMWLPPTMIGFGFFVPYVIIIIMGTKGIGQAA